MSQADEQLLNTTDSVQQLDLTQQQAVNSGEQFANITQVSTKATQAHTNATEASTEDLAESGESVQGLIGNLGKLLITMLGLDAARDKLDAVGESLDSLLCSLCGILHFRCKFSRLFRQHSKLN